jgi:hypothetical protein
MVVIDIDSASCRYLVLPLSIHYISPSGIDKLIVDHQFIESSIRANMHPNYSDKYSDDDEFIFNSSTFCMLVLYSGVSEFESFPFPFFAGVNIAIRWI